MTSITEENSHDEQYYGMSSVIYANILPVLGVRQYG